MTTNNFTLNMHVKNKNMIAIEGERWRNREIKTGKRVKSLTCAPRSL